MKLVLRRDFDDGACTLGKLTLDDWVRELIERPWVGGALGGVPGRSCVPIGTYALERHNSEAHPFTFALVNHALGVAHYPTPGVPRAACLIHPANWAYELRGCLAPGLTRLKSGDLWQVTQSRVAFQELSDRLPWIEGHSIEIVRVADLGG